MVFRCKLVDGVRGHGCNKSRLTQKFDTDNGLSRNSYGLPGPNPDPTINGQGRSPDPMKRNNNQIEDFYKVETNVGSTRSGRAGVGRRRGRAGVSGWGVPDLLWARPAGPARPSRPARRAHPTRPVHSTLDVVRKDTSGASREKRWNGPRKKRSLLTMFLNKIGKNDHTVDFQLGD